MATIVNTRIPVSQLRVGDLFVAVSQLPTSDRRSHGAVAEVRHITAPCRAEASRVVISDYTVHYTVTDDPSGMCYGGDVTLPPRALVTRLEVI